MRLTWKDGLAGVFVAVAVALYGWSLADSAAIGLSTRGLAVVIFGLGMAGCYSARSQLEAVYGVADQPRPPASYVVLVSALGAVALVAGIIALVTGSAAALATLVATMIALWACATIRHQAPTGNRQLTPNR
jgi:hypothetical protein